MKKAAGFTLIEVLIVVTLIAILTAIALPSYQDYVRRGKLTEANSNLSDVRLRLEKFYSDNRMYGTAGVCGVLMPAATDQRYFTITCVSANAAGAGDQTYVITAAGVAAQGMGGFTYTLDQSNTRTSTITLAGWNNSATCWVSKKGESC
jgi:type IV pilus assembly protein PilE